MSEKSDFNDLHLEHGLQVVKQQLFEGLERWLGAATAESEPTQSLYDSPPISAYKEFPEEREHFEGYADHQEKPDLIERVDLAGALERFCFVVPAGDIWDSSTKRRMKKTALKDFLGLEVYKAWLGDEKRQSISDERVKFILVAAAKARAPLAPDWQQQFLRTETWQIKADIHNAQLVLLNDERWAGVLGHCDFSYRVIKRKVPPFAGSEEGEWTDSDTDRFRIWLAKEYGFTPRTADAHGAVVVASENNRFHPVQDYLNSIEWDGKPRVQHWLHEYLGAKDTPYTQRVSAFFLISAVVRIMVPPVKVDTVLILEGLQGLGKSTVFEILAGQQWFSDAPMNLGDKDSLQGLVGVWIQELAELDALNKAESTRSKQFFGIKTDRYRPSYGRIAISVPRQCVFVGSTNQESYLKDATGNRRYWPVMCSKIEKERLQQDRDQLWAEAVALWRRGINWWVADKDKHLFEREQESRYETDVWQEKIEEWLNGHTRQVVLMSEIFDDALKMPAALWKPPEQKRVGQIMTHLGWRKTRPRKDGERVYGYERPVIVAPESDTF